MIAEVIVQLKENSKVFKSLLKALPETQIHWRPRPKNWSMLELVCHLRDEEKEDFRMRIQAVLEDPSLPLPGINPEAWVKDRKYNKQDFKKVKKSFFKERKASIKWLKKLHDAKWENAYIHPEYGAMSARMFLTNWLAHDYLHIRQLIKLKYDFLKEKSGENMKYAGDWG